MEKCILRDKSRKKANVSNTRISRIRINNEGSVTRRYTRTTSIVKRKQQILTKNPRKCYVFERLDVNKQTSLKSISFVKRNIIVDTILNEEVKNHGKTKDDNEKKEEKKK